MSHQSRVKVSHYAAALIVAPGGMKSTRRMPFLSQKTDAMIFFTEIEVLNFLVLGECVWRHCSDCCLDSEFGVNPMFHLQSQWSPETHLLPCVAREKLQSETHPFRFVIFISLGTQCAHNFLYRKFSVTAS